jgi:hypothetical protein
LLRTQPERVRAFAARQAEQTQGLAHPEWLTYALLWYAAIFGGFALLAALAPTWLFRWPPTASISAYMISILAIAGIVSLVATGPLIALRRFDRKS